MHLEFLFSEFKKNPDKTALVYKERLYSYNSLLSNIDYWKKKLTGDYSVKEGSVVELTGDFTFNTISILLALSDICCIIVPLSISNKSGKKNFTEISNPEFIIEVNDEDEVTVLNSHNKTDHELINILRERRNPGLILFSSGTSGSPKAAVHDFTKLLGKFRTKRESFITINFLLFDHWGGLNTLFHTLSNSGTVIATGQRSPDNICRLIEKYRAGLLPASPTFLNLLLISEAYKRYDLSSLKVISYGTEPMSAVTLKKLYSVFPNVKLTQTYGLIEVGVLRTKSREDGSLWLKLGGEGFEVRVREGILQIKSESAILGYLNYPSPFTDDGYFITGDIAETDGEYYRILGRKTDLINAGGEKVYPAEIENVIKEMENVADVTVYGKKNPVTGNIICADVNLIKEENINEFRQKLKSYCREKLQSYKIPSKINIVKEQKIGERFKKKPQ